MKIQLTPKRILWLLLSLILPALILAFRPFGMNTNQTVVFAALVLVLFWWVSNCLPKWLSSAVLLLIFSVFGGTPLKSVFQFPLSDNSIVILFAFLFSQGVANSGLTRRLLQPLFYHWIHTPVQFLLFVILCNTALIFIIPQPFARVILFAFIANEFLDDVCRDEKRRGILMFAVFVFSMSSNMLFLRGDIIMNYAVQSFGGVVLTEGRWAAAMTLPTLLLMAAELGALLLLYRRELTRVRFDAPPVREAQPPVTAANRWTLALIVVTMALFATQSLHGVAAKWVILASSLIMFAMGLLKFRDIKSINFQLLIWLTAAFSIGTVMSGSGTADIIFSRLSVLFPDKFGYAFLLAVIVITMGLHMVLGGSVTTTSVVIPGIVSIAAGSAPAELLVLVIYVLVYNHFLLPIHNAVLVIGNGDKRFPNDIVMRFGGVLTVLMPFFTLFVYYGWWQLIKLF